jgi:hypothetical protein
MIHGRHPFVLEISLERYQYAHLFPSVLFGGVLGLAESPFMLALPSARSHIDLC